MNFFTYLALGLECAVCKYRDCVVRYVPERKIYAWTYSRQYVLKECQKRNKTRLKKQALSQ